MPIFRCPLNARPISYSTSARASLLPAWLDNAANARAVCGSILAEKAADDVIAKVAEFEITLCDRQDVSVGVEELDQNKLTLLLQLRYRGSIADAVADLGKPDEIGRVFTGFQKFLYQPAA